MITKPETIAHIDLDSFFVSVEILKNPSLRGLPVIVGGGDRGVVSTCSYEARKFGVHSAMPSVRAKQLCPDAIFIKGSYSDYSRFSRWVTEIISETAPLFEKASVDEFYIDLTGMEKFFDPLQWTIALRKRITAETGLPLSFGIAANKMLAKMATNIAKPNGFLQVLPGKEKVFLTPLLVQDIPGVGKHTTTQLHALKLFTIGDLYNTGQQTLEANFGKWGGELWQKSQGIYSSKVSAYHEAKSISSERTFDENKTNLIFLNAELVRLTEKVCFELRTEEKKTRCVAIKIKYADFEIKSRQMAITSSSADDEIIPVVKALFKQLYDAKQSIRLLGVKLSDFTSEALQTNLFSDAGKKTILYKALDGVKNRFGKTAIKRASSN